MLYGCGSGIRLFVVTRVAEANWHVNMVQTGQPHVYEDAPIVSFPKTTLIKRNLGKRIKAEEGSHPKMYPTYYNGDPERGMTKEFEANAWQR